MSQKRVGNYFLEKGLITPTELEHILDHSKKTGLRFGDAAKDLGIVQTSDLIKVFGPSWETEFFYLDPTFFPQSTKDVFQVPEILKFGVLPLGLKKSFGLFKRGKFLNIGVLNPGDLQNIKNIEHLAKKRLEKENLLGVKIFLVLSDQFLDVLREIYGKSESDILAEAGVDQVLAHYLGA